jgi:multiple sugar transport system substrate-binding protein
MSYLSKLTVSLWVAMGLVLLLSGCQLVLQFQGTPQDIDARDPKALETINPQRTLLVFWHALTGAEEARLLDMIDAFNANNAWDITVVGEYQGRQKELYDKVIAGVSTNQLPNLVLTGRSQIATFASQDVAVALERYMDSEKWGFTPQALKDFFPSALSSEGLPQFKDKLFSLPFYHSLQVLYYNLNWLKELGYEAPPQTWEDFRAIACAASQPAEGLYGYQMGTDSLLFIQMLAAQEATLLNPTATAYTLGGQQGQAVLQFLQDLITDGCAIWEEEEKEKTLADFGEGQVLFTIGSTDELPMYQYATEEGANFDWGIAPLPHTTEEPVSGVRGDSLCILRSTPQEQLAAWLFVKWLTEPTQQAHSLPALPGSQDSGRFPVRRSALEAMDDYLAQHPKRRQAAQLLENQWVTEPGVTNYDACDAQITNMLYAMTAGGDVKQWLDESRERCNQSLISASRDDVDP